MPDLKTKKVTIIIPCYNGEKYLKESIDSALNQTYKNIEVIVVNDGSTDNSLNIIYSYKSQVVLVNQNNEGLSAARNSGINKSTGDLIAFLDADDFWEPTFIEKLVNALTKSDAVLAYCGWQNIGIEGPAGRPYIPPDYEHSSIKTKKLIEGPCWPVHAVIIRKATLTTCGLFNTQLKCCEDFDLWLRTAVFNPVTLVPEVLAYYRHHDEQMTRNIVNIALTHLKVQTDFLNKHKNIAVALGNNTTRDITLGRLLNQAYICYWNGDLYSARILFRKIMKHCYGTIKDWKYMLPSFLPYRLHYLLQKMIRKQ